MYGNRSAVPAITGSIYNAAIRYKQVALGWRL
jgi:hypothetical protein